MNTLILSIALALIACGDKDDTGTAGDGGATDGGTTDGGTTDGGSDGGTTDGGSDGGTGDGGSDGGTTDGGSDGGTGDGGSDGGTGDGGGDGGSTGADWSYDGKTGPDSWGDLDAEYAACGEGTAQSPIDLDPGTTPQDLDDMVPAYSASTISIENNGHTVEWHVDSGSTLTVGSATYDLEQFHFHAGSEHTVGGEQFDLEMHLVHKDSSGAYAVVGVLILAGAPNPTLAEAGWESMPKAADGTYEDSGSTFDISAALPSSPAYRYDGSLTTPPCTEGVAWHVYEAPITMSKEQIATFTALYDHNFRPSQDLNGRTVYLGD